MCFRPAEATAPQICPECGAEIAVIAGIRQKNCPFCNAVLPAEEPAAAPASTAPAMAPSAPSTPAAPTAPAAPAAPTAPAPVGTSSEQAAVKPASPTQAPTSQDNKPFNPFNR